MSCNCQMTVPSARKPQGEWRTGIKSHPLYSMWKHMKYRCKFGTRYEKNYASRGIKVCQQWLDDFRVFLKDMGTRPANKPSLDRKDNDRGYCPHNCRWATPFQQSLNSRIISRKGNLPRWITLTRSGTYAVKRSVGGRLVQGGVFKKRTDAVKSARKLRERYGN